MGIIDVIIAYTFIKDLTVPFNKTLAFKYGIIDAEGKILKKRNTLSSKERSAYPTILTTLAWNIKKILSKVGIGRSSIASFASALYLLKEEIRGEGMNMEKIKPEEDLLHVIQKSLYSSGRENMINDAFESSLLPLEIPMGDYRIHDEEVTIKSRKSTFSYIMGVPLYEAETREGKRVVFSFTDIQEQSVAPANNVGSGMVKGIAPGEEPPVRARRKKIYELMGRYTVFEISPEDFERCSCAKKKFEKWNKFFDEDSETGSEIKKYSYNNPEKGIILRNSETGQTMMFRRRWSDQRLTHNKKAKVLVQSNEKVYSIWTR